jgi:hypothetical protein
MTDPNMDFSRIIEAARAHYENLKADIENASNRIEHIRLTALTQEAHKLLTDIEIFEIGFVYTRISSMGPEDLERYRDVLNAREKIASDLNSSASADTPLDLPEFKSPFTPPAAM